MTSLIETENLLKMTEIVSGGVIEGSLMFEIPKNATNLMLYYTLPTLFSKETLSVNLELEHEVKNTLTPSLSFNENWLFGERLVPIELENMILTVFHMIKSMKQLIAKRKMENHLLSSMYNLKIEVRQIKTIVPMILNY